MTLQLQEERPTRCTPLLLFRALMIMLLVTSSVVVVGAGPAQAAVGNILPPFTVGETWKIYQGYGPDAYTHHNNGTYPSLYGLDLTHGGTDTSSAGKVVKAPIGGTVTYSSGSGTLCINTPSNGPSIALTHIIASVPNGPVTAGATVGTVAAARDKNNGGVAHIHFQRWSTNGCWSTGNGGIPFDSAHNAQICGVPDLTATGGGGTNGVWSGTTITGDICGSTPPLSPTLQDIQHVYVGTSAGTAHETYWGGGNSLTVAPVGNVGQSVTSISAQITSDNVQHVYAGTSAGTLHETYWGGGNSLPNTTSQLASLGSAITSISTQITGSVQHIYSGTQGGAIHETYWGGGNALTTSQLAAFASAVTSISI